MGRIVSILCLALGLGTLAACDTVQKGFSHDTPQVVAAPDIVAARLADAADRVSSALETLAAVEHARTPAVGIAPISGAPRELRRAVTVNWVGPVEPIVKMMAERANYGYKAFGRPPVNALVVSVDAENMPIIEVMRDIGLQLGRRADVKVNGDTRMVEIHYAFIGEIEAVE